MSTASRTESDPIVVLGLALLGISVVHVALMEGANLLASSARE